MSDLILPAVTLFRFNSEMLSVGLADLDHKDAVHRLKKGDGSSIAYLVGHIASSRYGLLKTLGGAKENPYGELFGAGVGSKDGSEYPPIEVLRAGWDTAAEELHRALDLLTDEDALRDDEGGFPIPDQTLRGRLTFIAWHESYHIGQIGILRTELGYPSMRKALYAARRAQ
ncbi:MAG: DinB family protein [Acidobacteriota bacterium]|nr:DinB family protein [Acidobacteriota bacterium]